MQTTVHRLWQDILGLLFPQLCPVCSQPLLATEHLCVACNSSLSPHPSLQHASQSSVFLKLAGQLAVDQVAAVYFFEPDGVLQQAIHQAKYNRHTRLAHYLGLRAAHTLSHTPFVQSLPPGTCIVPIPLHPWRLWWRGYNQTALLAQGLADGLQLPVAPKLLVRQRYTRSQVGLGREARHRNVQNAFSLARGAPIPHSVLLIDDVLTTGATLASAARTLLAAGLPQVHILALATPREQF